VKNVKFNLVLFPALIGLLPMPGGAIFSAPMVDELGREHELDPETKSLLNYWFRHIWEYTWPLYPGVLLAASLASVNVWAFISRSFPLTLVSMAVGYVFLLRNISLNTSSHTSQTKDTPLFPFFKEIIPIAIVIVGAISGSVCITWFQQSLPAFKDVPAELPLVISLFLSILYVWKVNHASAEVIQSILVNKALLKMIYMISAIYIFKQILVDSEAVVELSSFLAAQQIPLLLVVIMLPAIVGFIAGIAVAFVGTTFPVLIFLLQTLHLEANMIPYLVLAFSSGFIGVMFSPLHVCFIFTREYFKSDFRLLYHRLWKPLSAMMVATLLYFSLLMMVA
jgi:integral membrane protein (TIGR00529 family)